MTEKVLLVESPAKAKTINKYLPGFKVMATYGHVRDLPSKNGSVLPDEDFKMVYEINPSSKKHVDAIAQVAKNAKEIYLATDPDREGESISWHVVEVLKEKKLIKPDTKISRVVFNEITKNAVQKAVANPREIDENLVNAQQTRRALDYLVGFSISPILWRKLPGSRSAGRVQSVALRLICERELEIEKFIRQEYYSISARFIHENGSINTKLIKTAGKKLEKLDISSKAQAIGIIDSIKDLKYHIGSVEKKKLTRNPQPPFTTSTLQQEASRKLGFSAKMTMQIAQKLYEGVAIAGDIVGLITYMRTDGVQISEEALEATRNYIQGNYGSKYLPKSARIYKTKAKNAQEAHEAIRPTNINLTPDQAKPYLDDVQYKLYDLIWKRAVASQMESVILDSVSVNIEDESKKNTFRATGSTINFDGFYRVYREGQDDQESEEEAIIPIVKENDKVSLANINENQHFTEPAPRYTEASLVKKLEELGIGRPSTYASIISVLQDRKYVRLEKKRFIPEERGFLVTTYLENFFNKYVQYDFTANMEENLDSISAGNANWKKVLREFWNNFYENVKEASGKPNEEVHALLDSAMESHLFPGEDVEEARKCPQDGGRLHLRIGRYGPFIGCSNYPNCNHIVKLEDMMSSQNQEQGGEGNNESAPIAKSSNTDFPKNLGEDENGNIIFLKKGPYGFYIQLGEDQEKKSKIKRSAIPKTINPLDITLEQAIALLSLPKNLGKYPGTEEDVIIGIGKFGPFVNYNKKYFSIKDANFLSMSLEDAIKIIDSQSNKYDKKGSKSSSGPIEKIAGVDIYKGPFGMLYIMVNEQKIRFPKGTKVDDLTEDIVKNLLESAKK